MRFHREKNRGFTLLEVLVSLGLLAMLVLTMMRLMSNGAEIWSNSDRDIRAVENDKVAIDFMRKMLQRAKPLDWKTPEADGVRAKAFVGQPNELLFAAPLPVVNAEQFGLYVFSIAARKTDEYARKALVVKYWPLDEESLDKTLENQANEEVIMTEVERISFSYFGDKEYIDGLDDPVWQDDWQAIRDFPLAVKMRIQRTKTDTEDVTAPVRMPWDSLVVTLLQRSLR